MNKYFTWESLLICVVGLSTIGLTLKTFVDNKKKDEALNKSEKENKDFRETLRIKQEEFSSAQESLRTELRTKSDSIRDLQRETIEAQNNTINNLTGGNSYPLVSFASIADDHCTLTVTNDGKLPIYDLSFSVGDLDEIDEALKANAISIENVADLYKPFATGSVNPHQSIIIGTFPFRSDRQSERKFIIQAGARNGNYSQSLLLRKKNGIWLKAIEVRKWGGKTIYHKIDPGYLNEGEKDPFKKAKG